MTTLAGLDSKKEVAIFTKFMADKKILIADPSASSRSSLFSIFRDLNIKPSQMTLVNTYAAAEEQIVALKPNIVVAEYDLGKRCGVELLQNQRAERPKETKECLFIIVTSNTSQSAVARAAEEDIDAYILKPFTPDMVRKLILKAALLKIKPPLYIKLIDEGKALLEQGKFDEAENKFKEAVPCDPNPSLAYYYIGQTRFIKKILNEAKGNYSKGLEYNKIHYKCLVGLYETFQTEKNYQNAYEVVKKISQYFPANPKRLAEVLRLAIMNGKYEDIERYYQIFINIDERDETLIKYVCAALVVCGKYYLSTKLGVTRAIELFKKAAATGTGRANIIKEIVTALIENGIFKEAKNFLERYPPALQSSTEYLILKFQVLNAEAPLQAIIAQGKELLDKNIIDENLYKIMLARYVEADMKTAAESLYYLAIKHFPNKKESFEKIYKPA
jgi:CheY-like chemotaxis protein/Tfp pilus assembly protein PilF